MKRIFYLISGYIALGLGIAGIPLPILPTVPFILLAAFCFARSSPKLEQYLLDHKVFGPHIVSWRERGAISRKGKIAALVTFAASIGLAAVFAPMPWALAPAAALIGGTWIWTRPEG